MLPAAETFFALQHRPGKVKDMRLDRPGASANECRYPPVAISEQSDDAMMTPDYNGLTFALSSPR